MDLTSSSTQTHLCQPDKKKSCAWCCGLYNARDWAREPLFTKLRTRTKKFAETPRTIESIQEFSTNTRGVEGSDHPDPDFFSCEFVGFLNRAETLVGCLLHPLGQGNKGIDWRGLGFHGAMACQGFYCRSFRELNRAEELVILGSIEDWYLYGLVISDVDYVKGFFRLVEERLGQPVDPERLLNPSTAKIVREFFLLKINWPSKKRHCSRRDFETLELTQPEHGCYGTLASHYSPSIFDLISDRVEPPYYTSFERQLAEMMVDELFSRLLKTW